MTLRSRPRPVGPPRGDEGLDDWFTRRLEAQGIAARGRGFPTARVLSVIALIVAVVALFWVIRDATGSSSDTSSTPTSANTQPQNSTGGNPPDSTGNTDGGATNPIPWKEVKVTIVNGNGITGAAGDAQNTLTQAGWKIVDTTDTDGGVTVDSTEVVYPPGKKAPGKSRGRPARTRRTGSPRRRHRRSRRPDHRRDRTGAGGPAQHHLTAGVRSPASNWSAR